MLVYRVEVGVKRGVLCLSMILLCDLRYVGLDINFVFFSF